MPVGAATGIDAGDATEAAASATILAAPPAAAPPTSSLQPKCFHASW